MKHGVFRSKGGQWLGRWQRLPAHREDSGYQFQQQNQPEELIYGITKALWNDNTRKQLDAGHAKGKSITKETALNGIGIPLHPGAEKFYKEAGLLK